LPQVLHAVAAETLRHAPASPRLAPAPRSKACKRRTGSVSTALPPVATLHHATTHHVHARPCKSSTASLHKALPFTGINQPAAKLFTPAQCRHTSPDSTAMHRHSSPAGVAYSRHKQANRAANAASQPGPGCSGLFKTVQTKLFHQASSKGCCRIAPLGVAHRT
jgi:hypothetical protein